MHRHAARVLVLNTLVFVVGREMAGSEDGGGGTGAMEEGRDAGRQARYESSEDGGGGSDRCSGGNDMMSVQFMQKVRSPIRLQSALSICSELCMTSGMLMVGYQSCVSSAGFSSMWRKDCSAQYSVPKFLSS